MFLIFIISFAYVFLSQKSLIPVVCRRVFFLAGLLYFYRALTMSVTVLPKPDPAWTCPKHSQLHNTRWGGVVRRGGEEGGREVVRR